MHKRKALIFGNGLGMALDPCFFALDRALSEAWGSDYIDNGHRRLIQQCMPAERNLAHRETRPTSEDDLDNLQRILAACDFISSFDTDEQHRWLSDLGRSFPDAIRRFVHIAASQFHFEGKNLPDAFASSLRAFIMESRSHVATLNYDDLLYESFTKTSVFHGFDCLIDGFNNTTFSPENSVRYRPHRTSFYLHLHGSPLYYTDRQGDVRKANRDQLINVIGNSATHVVLTHVRHKMNVVSASDLLRSYWESLDVALDEAREVVLFRIFWSR